MLVGIDVSSWQKDYNIAASDADFVIVKATQGTDYKNPYMENQANRTLESGKLLGFYHYAGGGDPVAEADYFLETVGQYLPDAVLALDWEENQNKSFNQHERWCLTFLMRIHQKAKRKPLLYINAKTVRSTDWRRIEALGFKLWLAGYPDLRDSWEIPSLIYRTEPWSKPTIWQYTNSGGSLDRNVFYGTKNDWLKRK